MKSVNNEYVALPEMITNFNGVGIPGLTATLLHRTDKKAIYKRWDNVYEVFRVKIAEATVIFDKEIPRRELYPNNESFGRWAWCYSDERSAMRMYANLDLIDDSSIDDETEA